MSSLSEQIRELGQIILQQRNKYSGLRFQLQLFSPNDPALQGQVEECFSHIQTLEKQFEGLKSLESPPQRESPSQSPVKRVVVQQKPIEEPAPLTIEVPTIELASPDPPVNSIPENSHHVNDNSFHEPTDISPEDSIEIPHQEEPISPPIEEANETVDENMDFMHNDSVDESDEGCSQVVVSAVATMKIRLDQQEYEFSKFKKKAKAKKEDLLREKEELNITVGELQTEKEKIEAQRVKDLQNVNRVEDERNSLKNEISLLNNKNDELANQLKSLKTKEDSISFELSKKDEIISKLEHTVRELSEATKGIQAHLARIEELQRNLQTKEQEGQDLIAKNEALQRDLNESQNLVKQNEELQVLLKKNEILVQEGEEKRKSLEVEFNKKIEKERAEMKKLFDEETQKKNQELQSMMEKNNQQFSEEIVRKNKELEEQLQKANDTVLNWKAEGEKVVNEKIAVVESKEKEIDGMKGIIKNQGIELEVLKGELVAFGEVKGKVKVLEDEKNELEEKVEKQEKEISGFKELKKKRKEIDEKVVFQEKKIAKLKGKIESFEEKNGSLIKENEELVGKAEEKKKAFLKLESQVKSVEGKNAELEKANLKLSSKVETKDGEIKELKKNVEKISGEVKELKKLNEKAESEKNEARIESLQAIKESKEKVKEASEKVKSKENEMKQSEKHHEDHYSALKTKAKARVKELNTAIISYKAEVANLKNELEAKNEEIKELHVKVEERASLPPVVVDAPAVVTELSGSETSVKKAKSLSAIKKMLSSQEPTSNLTTPEKPHKNNNKKEIEKKETDKKEIDLTAPSSSASSASTTPVASGKRKKGAEEDTITPPPQSKKIKVNNESDEKPVEILNEKGVKRPRTTGDVAPDPSPIKRQKKNDVEEQQNEPPAKPTKKSDKKETAAPVSEKQNETPAKKISLGKKSPASSEKKPTTTTPSKKKEWVIAFSGFKDNTEYDTAMKNQLLEQAKSLGAEIQTSEAFEYRISHVVCPPFATKTMKTLGAILTGRWVMTPEWITNSFHAGSFISEENLGKRTTTKPYKKKKFFISQLFVSNSKERMSHLEALIKLGDGVRTTKVEEADYVVIYKSDESNSYSQAILLWSTFLTEITSLLEPKQPILIESEKSETETPEPKKRAPKKKTK